MMRTNGISERLLQLGEAHLAGQAPTITDVLQGIGTLEFHHVYFILDQLGPKMARKERRTLLDLLTEVVVLSRLDVSLIKQTLETQVKQQIRGTGKLGEYIYQLLKQVHLGDQYVVQLPIFVWLAHKSPRNSLGLHPYSKGISH